MIPPTHDKIHVSEISAELMHFGQIFFDVFLHPSITLGREEQHVIIDEPITTEKIVIIQKLFLRFERQVESMKGKGGVCRCGVCQRRFFRNSVVKSIAAK